MPRMRTAQASLLGIILFASSLSIGLFDKKGLAAAILIYGTLLLYSPRIGRIPARHFAIPALLLVWLTYSSTHSPTRATSIELLLVQACVFILVLIILHTLPAEDWIRALYGACLAAVVTNIAYTCAFPGGAFSIYGMKGVYANKNNMGAVMGIAAIVFYFSQNASNRTLQRLGFLCAVALLLLSQSKTSIGVTALAIFLTKAAAGLTRTINQKTDQFTRETIYFAVIPTHALVGSLGIGLIIFRESINSYLVNHIPLTFLTGRGELWVSVLSRMKNNLVSGLGLGTYFSVGSASEVTRTDLFFNSRQWATQLAGADNGYVDIIAASGYVGLAVVILWVYISITAAVKHADKTDGRVLLGLQAYCILHNFTETTFFLSTNFLWIVYLLSVGETSRAAGKNTS